MKIEVVDEIMKLTKTQQAVVDRYLEATKGCPESRMPIEKLIGMKSKIPKYRPDRTVLLKCEQAYLEEPLEEVGRPKRQLDNKFISSVLVGVDFSAARERFYWLDDIIVGISRLGLGGNTRPLNKGMLYTFISTSSVINTTVISSFCEVGDRQAQKIMLSLCIAHRMIEKELKRMGYTLDDCGLDL